MLKLKRLLFIPILMVMVLFFAVSGGVDAKLAGQCPDPYRTVGPAVTGHMEFFVDATYGPSIHFVGSCGNVADIDTTFDYDWGRGLGPTLLESDLVCYGPSCPGGENFGAVIKVPLGEVSPLQLCYRTDVQAICLKFISVRNFSGTPGNYSADVIMLLVVPQ